MKRGQIGFTIVELLIVVVIIAVLAAITTAVFSGMQQRARDTARKADIAHIVRAIQAYKVDNGNAVTTNTGCGYGGNGAGWFAYDFDGAGSLKSVSQCLVDFKLAQKEYIDPSGRRDCYSGGTGAQCYAYIKVDCGSTTYIMAHLESEAQSSTATDDTCAGSYDTDWGVNYLVRI